MIELARAEKLLAGFRNRKVLVIGDVMLDRYIAGSVKRISPEAPVPVVCVNGEYSRPGGAANVALNIQSLGGQAILAGVVGRDGPGDELVQILSSGGICTDGIIVSEQDRTTVKTRILADRQQVVRVDHEGSGVVDESTLDAFCKKIATMVGQVDGIVIEDYGKGVITQKLLDTVTQTVAKLGNIPVGLDPKFGHDLDVNGITLTTPNYKEACSAAGLSESKIADDSKMNVNVVMAGNYMLDAWNAKIVLVTLGSHGMCLMVKGEEPKFIPTRAREVFDVSGAGDTVIATAMIALASGADYYEAATLANYAAGVVVGKLGTATCSDRELLHSVKNG